MPAASSTTPVATSGPVVAVGPSVFQAIFDSSPEAIALTRVRDGALVQVNTEWLNMTGYTRDEVVGKTAVELGHWLDPQERDRVFGALDIGGRITDTDVTLVMKDRVPRVVRLNAAMMQDAGERYLLIYLRDVTADRMAREALQAASKRCQRL